MEESLILQDYLDQLFQVTEKDYTQYSPLALAFIGDGVYDLVIRTVMIKKGNRQAVKIHRDTTELVKAGTQAKMIAALLPHLTSEETAVYRRGHNAKPYNTAKNASREEYLEATGFEALMGYLYLQRQDKRMLDLVALALKEIGYEG